MDRGNLITTRKGALWREADGTLVEWDLSEVRVTRPWPLPRCWAKSPGPFSRWREVYGRVVPWVWKPDAPTRVRSWAGEARLAAWSTVPVPVREAWLAAHTAGDRWGLFTLLARCPGAIELAHSVPILAGGLSSPSELGKRVARPHRSARALLAVPDGMQRWRKVAAWLGFDGSRAFVNLLRRIPLGTGFGTMHQRALRRVWADPMGRKRLLHAPRVDSAVVLLLHAAVERGVVAELHPDLLEDTFDNGPWPTASAWFDEAVMHWRHEHPGRPLPSWRTGTAVQASVRRERARPPSQPWGGGPVPPFPPPPLPDGPGIAALASPEALVAEGQAMQHCLGWAAWEVEARARLGFAYRVEVEGERATLWLKRDPSEPAGFLVRQLQGPKNQRPSAGLMRRVAEWLVSHTPPPGKAPRGLQGAWATVAAPAHSVALPLAPAAGFDDDIPF